MENASPKKGGLFSALGFGKKEATAESLIADVEERTSKIEKAVGGDEKRSLFSVFGGGKAKAIEKEVTVETSVQQENVWTEGLKNLFQRYAALFTQKSIYWLCLLLMIPIHSLELLTHLLRPS
jgi:hypothetical protein